MRRRTVREPAAPPSIYHRRPVLIVDLLPTGRQSVRWSVADPAANETGILQRAELRCRRVTSAHATTTALTAAAAVSGWYWLR